MEYGNGMDLWSLDLDWLRIHVYEDNFVSDHYDELLNYCSMHVLHSTWGLVLGERNNLAF